jgi:hypothetical protein
MVLNKMTACSISAWAKVMQVAAGHPLVEDFSPFEHGILPGVTERQTVMRAPWCRNIFEVKDLWLCGLRLVDAPMVSRSVKVHHLVANYLPLNYSVQSRAWQRGQAPGFYKIEKITI